MAVDNNVCGIDRCGSPLERALAEAFASCGKFEWRTPDLHPWEIGRWPGSFLALIAQGKYGPYWTDFGICSFFKEDFESVPFIVIIEVDGHEFHEKTKEQAAHDKRRDRYMTVTEAKLFRFTGREVYADAVECAMEVLEYVNRIQQKNLKGHWKRFIAERAAIDAPTPTPFQ